MLKQITTITFLLGAIVTLLSLSYWQVQRLNWKVNIIERLEAEYQKDPTLNQFTFNDLKQFNMAKQPLLYGSATGKFIYRKEIFVGPKPLEGSIGYQVITPFRFTTGGYILVNRGWVDKVQKEDLKNKRSSKNTTISGIFRKTDWNRFTPDNSPRNNVWTKLDIHEIANVQDINPVAAVMLYTETKTSNIIIPQSKKWYPRNKHQQYAIFWFVMALALISVFSVFYWKNKK